MLFWLVVIFSIYTFLKIYISVMEIGYVTSLRSKEPILLDPKKYIEAASYTIRKERVNLVESFVEYLLFLFWIFVGFKYLQSISGADDSYKSNIIFLALFFLINFIVTLPFDYYRKFVIDKAFGFNKMSVKMWIGDILKELIMSLIIGGILVLFLIYVIKNYQLWWLWGFIFSFLVAIFVLFIYPTIIAPLFNKFEPLKDKELNDDIEALLNRVGLKSNGVFVMDASKRDSRLNAYFGGLGKSKRVVLFDTLLNKLNKNELLAVLGHELGHFSNKDVLKNIVIFAIFLFITFYILGHLPKELFFDMG
ncbi:MAG: M48 family metallopeptidase, partial [Epsilonproteobacteria bacterium]|nr:M48 family metallopeptidase [Campylobacterota bacterium]